MALTTRKQPLDVARALAIIGMIVAHLNADVPTGFSVNHVSSVLNVLMHLPDGVSSTLFVIVAGTSVVYLSANKAAWASLTSILIRGGLLIPLGWLLTARANNILVILDMYLAFMLLAWVINRFSTSTVLTATVCAFILAPLLLIWLREIQQINPGSGLVWVISYVFVFSSYPLLSYGPAVMLGVLFTRIDLEDKRLLMPLSQALSALSMGVLVLGWVSNLTPLDGSITHGINPLFDPLAHTGSIVSVAKQSLWASWVFILVHGLGSSKGPASLLWTSCAYMGRLGLTIYVLHIMWLEPYGYALLAVFRSATSWMPAMLGGMQALAIVIVAMSLAGLWLGTLNMARGPLEAVMSLAANGGVLVVGWIISLVSPKAARIRLATVPGGAATGPKEETVVAPDGTEHPLSKMTRLAYLDHCAQVKPEMATSFTPGKSALPPAPPTAPLYSQ